MLFSRLKPAVSKYWLIAASGLMWSTVGIMLCKLAYRWLTTILWNWAVPLGFLGIISAWVAYYLGFSKIALKNIDRLCLFSEKVCLFAFQTWESYLIIGLMVTFSTILRHSPIPKQYLSVIYLTIGGALLLSSFHYYLRLWYVIILKQPCLPYEENDEPRSMD